MANSPKKKSDRTGVTASGIVEAVEQDLELSIEQVKDAVEAVEKKLSARRSSKPTTKAAKPTKSDPAGAVKKPADKNRR